MMSKILGLLLILAGIALGLYVGVWLFLIGGIVGLADVVTGGSTDVALDIGISLAKIMFAGLAGMVSGFALISPGIGLLFRTK